MLKPFAIAALTLALGTGAALAQGSSGSTTTAPTATPPASHATTPPAKVGADMKAGADVKTGADTKAATPSKSAQLDINSASAKELSAKFPTLGEKHAEAIVKGRPYKGTDELVQKKILPETVYAQIKNQITVKQN